VGLTPIQKGNEQEMTGVNAFAFTDARELLMRVSGNLDRKEERERDFCVTDNAR